MQTVKRGEAQRAASRIYGGLDETMFTIVLLSWLSARVRPGIEARVLLNAAAHVSERRPKRVWPSAVPA